MGDEKGIWDLEEYKKQQTKDLRQFGLYFFDREDPKSLLRHPLCAAPTASFSVSPFGGCWFLPMPEPAEAAGGAIGAGDLKHGVPGELLAAPFMKAARMAIARVAMERGTGMSSAGGRSLTGRPKWQRV